MSTVMAKEEIVQIATLTESIFDSGLDSEDKFQEIVVLLTPLLEITSI